MSDKVIGASIRSASAQTQNPPNETKIKRIGHSKQMARELQLLFGKLLYTN